MTENWQFWALVSAAFAALTAIFAKIGISGINSDFATFIRTLVIIAALCMFLTVSGQRQKTSDISASNWLFLILSGLATGASWLAYFRALKIGDAAWVTPVDKLSIILVAIFGVFFSGREIISTELDGHCFNCCRCHFTEFAFIEPDFKDSLDQTI